MQDEVASTILTAVKPTGERKEVRIAIARPVQTSHGDWSCQVVGGDLIRGPRVGVIGIDSLQALCLAIALVRSQLHEFLGKGGRLLHVDDAGEDSEFPISAIFGGSLHATI